MPALQNFDVRGAFGRLALMLALAVFVHAAQAHKASDAYLSVVQRGDDITVRWEVALRDLDAVLAIDADDDERMTWGELKARQLDIESHLLSQWAMRPLDPGRDVKAVKATDCAFVPLRVAGIGSEPTLERRVDGTYYVFTMHSACHSTAGQFEIRYQLMRGVDPTHRGLLQVTGPQPDLLSLSPNAEGYAVTLALASTGLVAPMSSLVQWWQDGIHHILIGTDHLLFLLCLLLPSVLRREPGPSGRDEVSPIERWQDAMSPLLMTITMFTLAHSVTLTLGGLDLVTVPSRIIEPAIALTIVLAAIDNIHPIFRGRRHLFTFLFGLVHGFGFAGSLAEMHLPLSGFTGALLAFNLGVESGQMMIVLPTLMLLLWMRGQSWYLLKIVPATSMAVMAIALGWFVERAFDLGFMPI